jgi:hypothetical protein
VGEWISCICLRKGTSGGLSVSVKGGEVLDQLSDSQLLKKDLVPRS